MKHSVLLAIFLPLNGVTNALESNASRSLRVRATKRELERSLAQDNFEKNKKCPSKEKDGLLFEKDVNNAEKCKDQCQKKDDCMFYSFGTDNSKPPGNCRGCTSDKNAEKDSGFNLYEMGTVEDVDDGCQKDMKCPKKEKDGFLFEKEGVKDAQKCQEQCEKDLGCLYYSFGTEGNCMGCTSDEKAEKVQGFNLCELGDTFEKNKRCPNKEKDGLLFEKKNVKNADKCKKECEGKNGCKFYSFGTDDSNDPGHCMGCTSDKNAKDDDGFNLYELEGAIDGDDHEKDMRCPEKENNGLLLEAFYVKNEKKCRRLCKKVDDCRFYSFGTEDSSSPGNCMGCDSDKKAKKVPGFILYKYQEEEEEEKEKFEKNKTCPTKENKGLLFEKNNVKNAGKCKDECKNNNKCKYYSFGTEESNNPGNCMGCTSDENAKEKDGFNLYPL